MGAEQVRASGPLTTLLCEEERAVAPWLAVQRYLRDSFAGHGGTLDDLLTTYGIKSKRHGRYPNLVLLKYDMTASPMHEPIVQECRGIILDEANDWNVVARAFDKFFNHGEGHAADIDWSTARVQEKLDGSLVCLFHYDGAWHVATSGTPDASGNVDGSSGTFAEYFWQTFAADGGEVSEAEDVNLCFAFELMGPANRIVVVHEKPWLRLLSVRHRVTGEQRAPEGYARALGIEAVRSFPLTSIADIVASFDAISPLSQEGYVVVDGAFRRIKVKHPGYVALHHAKDGMGPKAFCEIARSGEVSEVLVAFPEFRPLLEAATAKYEALVRSVEADYRRIEFIETQKDFALEAVKLTCSAALFQRRKGVPVRTFLKDASVDKVMAWMDQVSP